jgi:ribosome-binding factor A
MRRLLAEIWDEEYAEEIPGMLTFTQVRLSSDLRYARAYWSYLGTPENRDSAQGLLERETRNLRRLVGKNLHLRHIPELSFKFDPSVEEGVRIEQLLNEIKSERKDESDSE